jgi:hypothetical protein
MRISNFSGPTFSSTDLSGSTISMNLDCGIVADGTSSG